MDNRIKLLDKVYIAHSDLVNFYHSKTQKENAPLLEFCSIFVEFINALNPRKSDKRFEYIFTQTPNLNDKNILNAHLFTAAEYASTLICRINESPALELENEIVVVIFDYAKMLDYAAKVYDLPTGNFAGNRNMQVDSYTSYKIAHQMFWGKKPIQRSNSLNGYTIFALRQAIELAGKELLGIDCLLNKNGKTFINGTQIPWEFITSNKSTSFFSLPFNPEEIQLIFQWSNQFVHTGKDAFCFATALALKTTKQLYQKKKVVYFDGREDFQWLNEIHNYSSLKSEFENFLRSKYPNHPKTVKWTPSPQLSVILG